MFLCNIYLYFDIIFSLYVICVDTHQVLLDDDNTHTHTHTYTFLLLHHLYSLTFSPLPQSVIPHYTLLGRPTLEVNHVIIKNTITWFTPSGTSINPNFCL